MSSVFLPVGVQFQVNLLLEGFTSQSRNRKYINLGHGNIIDLANEFAWEDK